MINIAIYLLFFGSGICGLVYQLLWQRKLTLIFGNTTNATSVILSAFMGGLALGSYLFGKLVDQKGKPLRIYAFLECGIGIAGLAILFFFLPISNSLYVLVFRTLTQNSFILTVVRFFLAIFILIIPTTLMGGTLPVISKYMIRESCHFGNRLGDLYATNTVGGMMGAFLTGYYLIRLFGETWTMWLAIIGNFIIAAIAYWLSHRTSITEKDEKKEMAKSEKKNAASHPSPKIRKYSASTAKLIIMLFAVAGFASLAHEVIWTRALIFYVSSMTYSFSAILTTFLFGLMLGSYVMAHWVDRVKNLILLFGLLEGLLAIFALLSIPALSNMDDLQRWLLKFIDVASWSETILFLFATTFVILLLPTLLMGAAFPLVNRIYVESIPKLGNGIGRVYMANTIGAVLGSFFSGFFIMPILGIARSILLIALINLVIGLVAIFYESNSGQKTIRRFVLAIALMLTFVSAAAIYYTKGPLITGIVSFKGTRLLYNKDASAATLSVLEKEEELNLWGRNIRYLNVNGHNTAHTTFADIVIHKMLAHLPMMLHPHPETALVVGFGLGNTCHSFLQYDLQHLDCVELIAEEKLTAKFFEPENHEVLNDPRLAYIVNDGRNYIMASDRCYDVISINAVDPKFSSSLYTKEFYQHCSKKLTSNGYLIAWLPLYGMTPAEVKALIKSFVYVFPHSSLWFSNPEHVLLLGSKKPQSVDLQRVTDQLKNIKVNASLAEIRLDNPYVLLSTYLMGEKDLAKLAAQSKMHSDDFPLVEFSKKTTADITYSIYLDLLENKSSIWSTCINTQALGELEQVRSESYRYEKSMFSMLKGLFLYRASAATDTSSAHEALNIMKEAIEVCPENKFNLMFFVDWVQPADLDQCALYYEQAVAEEPKFAKGYVVLGLQKANLGDWPTAIEKYQLALAINDKFISAHFNSGYAYTQIDNWLAAKDAFEKVILLQPENVFAHSSLCQVYNMLKNFDEAIAHGKKAIELQPSQANYYFNLGMIYRNKNNIAEAIDAFERGLRLAPNDRRALQILRQLKDNL